MKFRLFVPVLLAALAVSASGETPSGTGDDPIVVTASQPDHATVDRQAGAVTFYDDPLHAPLAQFDGPICPGVAGLKSDYGLAIVERMRFDIQRLGLKLEQAGDCSPNVLVMFVANGQAELHGLVDADRHLLDALPPRERKRLLADAGPVHAWVVTQLRSADGMTPAPGDGVQGMRVREMSRITLGHRRDIVQSYVMIDFAAIAGTTTQQLADYAVMRGLARTQPPKGGTGLATILTLFEPDAGPPGELTDFDVAYLKNLYAGPRNYTGSRKLGGVADALRKEQSGKE